MPGAIARRKRSSKIVPADSKRGAAIISSFIRVSKPLTSGKDLGDKVLSAKAAGTLTIDIPILPSKKRKATTQDENDCVGPQISSRNLKKPCRKELRTIQDNQQLPGVIPASVLPQKDLELCGTQPLLARLSLHNSDKKAHSQLPQELTDLVNLHISFTKALTIHYAHNGSGAPVDVRALCPSITQSWGKRKVTLDDIQRCIGVLEMSTGLSTPTTTAPFHLADYGRSKICIELRPNASSIINETKLNRIFEKNLASLWSTTSNCSPTEVRRFLAGLPKASVARCESIAKAGPVLAKGQRTLEELKHGILLKKQQEVERKAQQAAPANPDGSKMSLIDRIRYKELLQSQQSGAPSPEELQRQAALQRAEDIAAVISMLSTATATGQKRVSYTMAVILTKLKDSLRVPISRDEGAACVRLLANEIAPQWLRVVTIGGKDNVVVLTDFAPTKAAIQDRVRQLSC